MPDSKVICWTDDKGCQHYDTQNDAKRYCKENGINPDFIFKRKDDTIWSTAEEEHNFRQQAYKYGFAFNDYNRIIKLADGNPAYFIGFCSRNKKYKCILRTVVDGRLIKCTPSFVIKHMVKEDIP